MLDKFRVYVFFTIFFVLILFQNQFLFSNIAYSSEKDSSKFSINLVNVNKNKCEPVGTVLKFKAICEGEDLKYKWSIYRNSNEIYTKEYSKDNLFEYPTTEIGVYKVGVAVQDKSGKILRTESEEVNVVDKVKLYSKKDLEKENIEKFVNNKDFSSKTDYFIWVNTEKNLVYIFKGKIHKWVLEKTMVCTDGKSSTPTVKGNFTINGRAPWLVSYNKKVKAKYKVRFYENYYFHSILYDSKGEKVIDSRLGKSISHGCIRLSVENAKWIYDNISDGTGVYIN
ncbi:L,D-transpeptidase [Tepidibacter thalassicus]|uniref:L,D-transpeptidase catalytic domain n=1 Tax=Tepidibacter thalassicus DSM 15285 TaxID=1123350 RepID=A0A1M5PMY0_9FIRM|nr:L,D-transpeptidase [Tepidibacter thalassicus]SHH02929.1 L,D-transpeptidase catalytic domain [Tepidibacter thalassicus DSM 15285]